MLNEMNRNWKRAIGGAVLAGALVFTTAASCDSPQSQNSDKMMEARNQKVAGITLCGEPNDSLTCKNLKEYEKRNSDPNRKSYVYLVNMNGQPFAYWVVRGRVSSTQAQMAPTDQVLDICPSTDRCWEVMEGPGDDGSSGPNEDGIFFFTFDGNHLVTVGGGNYILSDAPFAIPGVKELAFQ